MTTASTSLATYQTVDIERNTLAYTAKDSAGRVLDKWTIRDAGKRKVVKNVERVGIVEYGLRVRVPRER